jgi:hypothetical protein
MTLRIMSWNRSYDKISHTRNYILSISINLNSKRQYACLAIDFLEDLPERIEAEEEETEI